MYAHRVIPNGKVVTVNIKWSKLPITFQILSPVAPLAPDKERGEHVSGIEFLNTN